MTILTFQGVFISFVFKGSPAAMAGLRFGDQILQINGDTVAGYDTDKVMKIFKKCDAQRIVLATRDRYGADFLNSLEGTSPFWWSYGWREESHSYIYMYR